MEFRTDPIRSRAELQAAIGSQVNVHLPRDLPPVRSGRCCDCSFRGEGSEAGTSLSLALLYMCVCVCLCVSSVCHFLRLNDPCLPRSPRLDQWSALVWLDYSPDGGATKASALVIRLHHALVDGINGLRFILDASGALVGRRVWWLCDHRELNGSDWMWMVVTIDLPPIDRESRGLVCGWMRLLPVAEKGPAFNLLKTWARAYDSR